MYLSTSIGIPAKPAEETIRIHHHWVATNVPNRAGRPTEPGGDCSPGRPGQLNSGRRLTASIICEDGRPRG